MLPAPYRMRDSADFIAASRSGVRKANKYVVIHVLKDDSGADLKVGFTVSKKVGNAVVRNSVRRRLRHIVRDYLSELDAQLIVIRALPASAHASSAELRTALNTEFDRLGILHD